MPRIFKRIAIGFGIIVGLLLIAGIGLMLSTESRMNKIYSIPAEKVTIPSDTASIAYGKHLVMAYCAGCHSKDLGGQPLFEASPIANIDAVNITSGKGGIGNTYNDEDWIRIIRHGVTPTGHSVMIMPSNNFNAMSDTDLGAIIAYVKTVPAVDRTPNERFFSPFGKALYALGAFGDMLTAEEINHNQQPSTPAVAVSAEYGGYLVTLASCRSCHGQQLSGGKNADPNALFAPNLTPGGALANWSEDQFITAIRTGKTPQGTQLNKAMPWENFSQFSDDELKAIWLYLKSQPTLATTTK